MQEDDRVFRRELPAYLQYINGPRVIAATPKNKPISADVVTAIEDEFTLGFRFDGWLDHHWSFAMHAVNDSRWCW